MKKVRKPRARKLNIIEIKENYAIMYTSKGNEILIDIEDIEKVNMYTWGMIGKYVQTINGSKGEEVQIYMHRFIMDCPKEMVVDHINHNTSDNRKQNLRICTHQQNDMNSKISKANKSNATGVGYFKRTETWRARIVNKGVSISLGYYKNKDDAIKARLDAEKIYYGEYAYSSC